MEYNQLDPLLRASGSDGDVNDESGFSPFPGNINQLLFRLDAYAQVLERTKGVMPEFVNPKYKDAEKMVFKKPTRLECMMQVRQHFQKSNQCTSRLLKLSLLKGLPGCTRRLRN